MYMLRRVYVYMFRRVCTEHLYVKESVRVYVQENVHCTFIC